ncbi:hypothetical protein ABZ570_29360 [Micromonospora sp. NPDC007271]|uniref:hypothetical protein n=1 Tax=Micromonospora sp. NPDC007271 TaxID=3154587 RepID=UPI0033D7E9D7
MTRRCGRWTRVALRLGLLLGGVVVAWGIYEGAATAPAHAADRPPAAPVDAAVDLLTGVLRPILGTTTPPPAPEGPAGETAPGMPPRGSDPHPVPGHPPAQPAPSQVTPPLAHPVRVGTPTPAVEDASRPTTRRRPLLAPVGDTLRPVTEPVRARVLTPVADALSPVTDPLRAGVLAPAADALRPVTQPLTPILSPVWRELEPVLEILDPVTDLLGPPTGPVATPPPAPAQPACTAGSGVTGADHARCARPSTGSFGQPAAPVSGPTPTSTSTDWHTTPQLSSPPGLARPDRPHPLRPDADSAPVTPVPGTGGSGSSGVAQGSLADAPGSVWTPPSLAGHRGHPTGGDTLPSRSPRPSTRPA